jgi:meiotically up-regulated gene 157 (Mug157) protein
MDDANVPSLLSIPYLGYRAADDETYARTRKMLLTEESNPWYFVGAAGIGGVGGPHIGYGYVWPMSLTMLALTSDDGPRRLGAVKRP